MSKYHYISDTHFRHGNIMRYCERPFANLEEMDNTMLKNMKESDEAGHKMIHCGDFSFHLEEFLYQNPTLSHSENHFFVVGNHDHGLSDFSIKKKLHGWFSKIVGERRTWKEHNFMVTDELNGKPVKVMVSHAPQENLKGCVYNVYGHIHNNALRQPEAEYAWYPWLANSPWHLNASVEVIDYKPRTLEELIALKPATIFQYERGVV